MGDLASAPPSSTGTPSAPGSWTLAPRPAHQMCSAHRSCESTTIYKSSSCPNLPWILGAPRKESAHGASFNWRKVPMATKQVLRNGENRAEKPSFHQIHSPQRMEGRDREFGPDIHALLYLKQRPPRSSCVAQGALFSVMWRLGWQGSLEENGYMYMYG